jgi:hypothetical protein
MIKAVARWEFQRLVQQSPGLRSLVFLALFPGLQLLPWKDLAFFDDAFHAAVMLTSLYAIVVASLIGGDAGQMRRSAFWLYQKGVAPAEYSFAAYFITLFFGAVLIILSSSVVAISAMIHDFPMIAAGVSVTIGLLLLVIVHTLLFLIASLSSIRRTEFMMLLVFLALLSDVLWIRASDTFRVVAHRALPPVTDAYRAATALFNGSWHVALGHTLHILVFLALVMTLSHAIQNRRRPTPSRLQVP